MSEEMPLVVVGVDGSEHGDAALRRALRETSRLGGRLEVVSAWERRGLTLAEYLDLPLGEEGEIQAELDRRARAQVDRVTATEPDHGVDVQVRAHAGRPTEVLPHDEEVRVAAGAPPSPPTAPASRCRPSPGSGSGSGKG